MRTGPKRGPQSVKKEFGTYGRGGRRKRQKGGAFPFGLIASAAAPFLGEIEKPIFKHILVGVKEEENDDEGNNNTTRSATPTQITLPNEETFVARYERTSRRNYPET